MKSIKIIIGTLFLASLMVVVSAYAMDSYKPNAFAMVCYKYSPPTHGTPPDDYRKKYILTGQINSLDCTEFTNTQNWTATTSTTISNNCNSGAYVCGICFSDDMTLQQALNLACTIFSNTATSTTPGFTHGADIDASSSIVIIYMKSTDANF